MKIKELLKCSHVLFDFDGTLVDSNGEAIRQIRLFLQRENIAEDPGFLERVKTMGPKASSQYYAQLCGGKYQPEEISSMFETAMRDFYFHRVKAKPGACEYVAELHRRGIRIGVASCSEEQEITAALNRLGVLDYFEFLATPSTTGIDSKTNPDFFLRAASMFPCGQLNNIVLYDDAYGSLATAKRMGMGTVAVWDKDNQKITRNLQTISNLYISSYWDVLDRLNK